ncbi:hypothetical protein FKM82_025951 [Ascaphus truei]
MSGRLASPLPFALEKLNLGIFILDFLIFMSPSSNSRSAWPDPPSLTSALGKSTSTPTSLPLNSGPEVVNLGIKSLGKVIVPV